MAHKNELNEAQKISFKNTLNLPQTDFPIRSNAAVEDLLIIERWNQEKLYEKDIILKYDKEIYEKERLD